MPPKPPANKKRRMVIIGAAALGLLVVLYIRSRNAQAPNATNAADLQNAMATGAQQQAATDAQLQSGITPSTFADNGANAAALSDAVTQGLDQINQTVASLQQDPLSPAPAAPAAPAPPPIAITVNNTGQPAATSGTKTTTTRPPAKPKPKLTTRGAIYAPFGHNKPAVKPGFTVKGLGGGYWEYLPKAKVK